MSKDKKPLDTVLSVVDVDPPSDKALRSSFWELCRELGLANSDWSKLMDKYLSDPANGYADGDKQKMRDRGTRLTNALTGGNKAGEQPEFMWTRFIEGVCILGADRLNVRIVPKRGKFGSKKLVESSTNPKADNAQHAAGAKHPIPNRVSERLGNMFANPVKTATRDMEHILSRLLWSTFAEYGIDKSSWEKQVHRYTHDSENCPALQYRRNDKKNNLQKAITNPKSVTWKRFLETLKVIDVRELEITFNIEIGKRDVEATTTIDITQLRFKSGGKDECTKP